MKKRILFTIDSLTIGGAEKSLVTLLNLLDYSRCEVDLQLFVYNGAFMSFLPKEVNVLPPLNYYDFLALPIWEQLLYPRMLLRRLLYSLRIRKTGLLHADKSCLYWQTIGRCIEINTHLYDVAIGYAQGIPTFYTVDKVAAKKKLVWIETLLHIWVAKRFKKNEIYWMPVYQVLDLK